MSELVPGGWFILMDIRGSSWMFSGVQSKMLMKPDLYDPAINAGAQRLEGTHLYGQNIIYIETQTGLLSFSPHYPVLCTTKCSPN